MVKRKRNTEEEEEEIKNLYVNDDERNLHHSVSLLPNLSAPACNISLADETEDFDPLKVDEAEVQANVVNHVRIREEETRKLQEKPMFEARPYLDVMADNRHAVFIFDDQNLSEMLSCVETFPVLDQLNGEPPIVLEACHTIENFMMQHKHTFEVKTQLSVGELLQGNLQGLIYKVDFASILLEYYRNNTGHIHYSGLDFDRLLIAIRNCNVTAFTNTMPVPVCFCTNIGENVIQKQEQAKIEGNSSRSEYDDEYQADRQALLELERSMGFDSMPQNGINTTLQRSRPNYEGVELRFQMPANFTSPENLVETIATEGHYNTLSYLSKYANIDHNELFVGCKKFVGKDGKEWCVVPDSLVLAAYIKKSVADMGGRFFAYFNNLYGNGKTLVVPLELAAHIATLMRATLLNKACIQKANTLYTGIALHPQFLDTNQSIILATGLKEDFNRPFETVVRFTLEWVDWWPYQTLPQKILLPCIDRTLQNVFYKTKFIDPVSGGVISVTELDATSMFRREQQVLYKRIKDEKKYLESTRDPNTGQITYLPYPNREYSRNVSFIPKEGGNYGSLYAPQRKYLKV